MDKSEKKKKKLQHRKIGIKMKNEIYFTQMFYVVTHFFAFFIDIVTKM